MVAGDVNLITPGRNQVYGYAEEMRMEKSVAPQQFQEKEFFEYHIYNLQRPATIAQNETKQISLFEAGDVKATKKFYYRSGGNQSYYYGNSSNTIKLL